MIRRTFLKTALLSSLSSSASAMSALFQPPPFALTDKEPSLLPIPPLYEGAQEEDERVFHLTLQGGTSELLAGKWTETFGINQAFLGPVLRIQPYEKVRMEVHNALSGRVALHWHGMILPALSDGGPLQSIEAGERWTARWKVMNQPATYFYHAHTLGHTGEQVWRGLFGQLHVVDSARDERLGLPNEYGVDDIPLTLFDRAFDENGNLFYRPWGPNIMYGMHGNVFLVNGAIQPTLKAQKTRLRFRVLNASNARFMQLRFSDGHPFYLIGTDGSLLDDPIELSELGLAPAERAEIIVDVSDRKQITLQALPGFGNLHRGPMANMMSGLDVKADLFTIDARHAALSENRQELLFFSTMTQDTEQKFAQQYHDRDDVWFMKLQMKRGPSMMLGQGGFLINGESMDAERVNETLTANRWMKVTIYNDSEMAHPMHIHNTQFRILSRNGQFPFPWEKGLKDTINVGPKESVTLLMPTGPYTDNTNTYMYHCHILEHEDSGMMGQFRVVS